MKFTNNHGLPDLLAKTLSWRKPPSGDVNISVTALLSPPRKRILETRYDHAITADVSDNLWAFLGSAGHLVLEKMAKTEDALSEERLVVSVNGWKIVGRPDLYYADKVIDLKLTSVYSYLFEKDNGGVKPEWEAQLNVYAYMLREHGFKVDKVENWMVLRDWQKSKCMSDEDYPKIPFINAPVPLWDQARCLEYITQRVKLHQAAEDCKADKDLPLCTEAERWTRPSTWAVMKKGNKRADRVFDSSADANAYCAQSNAGKGVYEVIERPGQEIRCQSYCNAAPFCDFAQGLK